VSPRKNGHLSEGGPATTRAPRYTPLISPLAHECALLPRHSENRIKLEFDFRRPPLLAAPLTIHLQNRGKEMKLTHSEIRHPLLSAALTAGLLLFTSNQAFASQASPTREDISLDPATGDTFITAIEGENSGRILWLNDFNESFEKTLSIPQSASRTEIEMNQPGRLATLLQLGEQWVLTGFERNTRGEWVPQPVEAAITGTGHASHLTTLPDGNLVVTVRERQHFDAESINPDDTDGEVLLIRDSGKTQGRYEILESIPESRIAERAESIASSIATGSGTPSVETESGNGLGFTAGLLSGVGLAYRRHFASKWGVQVGGIAFGDKSNLMLSLGVNVMRTLSMTQKIRFYAVFGASTFYSGTQGYDYSGVPVDCYSSADPKACAPRETGWQNSASLNFGAGIGMEFMLAKNLGLALELPVTVMLDITDTSLAFGRVYPIPTGSLVYYF
jgi:hypothetical protein